MFSIPLTCLLQQLGRHVQVYQGGADALVPEVVTLPRFHVQQEGGSFLLTEKGNERKQRAQEAIYGRL